MKNKVKRVSKILLAVMLVVSSSFSMYKVNANAQTTKKFESGKEILYYIFYTQNGICDEVTTQLQNDLNLSEETINTIKSIGLEQHTENDKIKKEYKDKTSAEDVAAFNNEIREEAKITTKSIKELLGKQYDDVEDLILSYWYKAKPSNNISLKSIAYPPSEKQVIVVWATQYDPIESGSFECALPDKYLKFANQGDPSYSYPDPPYTVSIQSYSHDTYVPDVLINEVGPWNEDDNYWQTYRRYYQFDDLELGQPEAAAAYFDNYNGGYSEHGYIVTNPAGIDLSPSVAAQLGFGYLESGYVTIYLNF